MGAAERPDHLRVVFGDGDERREPEPVTSDVDLEDNVVLNAIYQPDVIGDLKAIIRPEHFESERCRQTIAVAFVLHDRGQPVDVLSVMHELRAINRLAQVGGADWLAKSLPGNGMSVMTPSNVLNHARRVHELHVRRQWLLYAKHSVTRAERDGAPLASLLDHARADLDAISAELTSGTLTSHVDQVADRVLADLMNENERGAGVVPTGYRSIDALVHGLPIDMTVVAGLPGDGKTSLLQGILVNVAQRGEGAMMDTLETAREELFVRMACQQSGVHMGRAVAGQLSSEELTRLLGGMKALRGLPLYIEERVYTVRGLWERARAVQLALHLQGRKLRVVAVDYLQLMEARRRYDDDRQTFADISKSLKALSLELGVAVVAVSQVNEEKVMARKGQRVKVGDLFGTSQIRKDARLILGVYNPDVRPDRPAGYRPTGIAEIDVLKHNKGPGVDKTADLSFEAESTTFRDLIAPRPVPPPPQTYTCGSCGARLEAGRSCACGATSTPAPSRELTPPPSWLDEGPDDDTSLFPAGFEPT